jgi:hypothetical protein
MLSMIACVDRKIMDGEGGAIDHAERRARFLMHIRVSRRQLAAVLTLTACGGAAAFLSIRPDRTHFTLTLPPAGDPNNPTLEIFEALCRLVLAREHLDITLTQRMYEVFADEPWGRKHIGHAYAALREAIAREAWSPRSGDTPPLARLDPGERWFVSHLVTTWYLGIYYHEQRPTQRITHDGALMYTALKDLAPVPYVEGYGFGRWADPPPPVSEHDR